jgi:hypothetical protein
MLVETVVLKWPKPIVPGGSARRNVHGLGAIQSTTTPGVARQEPTGEGADAGERPLDLRISLGRAWPPASLSDVPGTFTDRALSFLIDGRPSDEAPVLELGRHREPGTAEQPTTWARAGGRRGEIG